MDIRTKENYQLSRTLVPSPVALITVLNILIYNLNISLVSVKSGNYLLYVPSFSRTLADRYINFHISSHSV